MQKLKNIIEGYGIIIGSEICDTRKSLIATMDRTGIHILTYNIIVGQSEIYHAKTYTDYNDVMGTWNYKDIYNMGIVILDRYKKEHG